MATIIEFRGTERLPTPQVKGGHGRKSAEVVIFPGIRFERWAPSPEQSSAKIKPKPHRDLLEIE